MSAAEDTGSSRDVTTVAPPPTLGGPPVGLLDLPDDALSLIAEHVWASKGDGSGLVGACRRTRRIGLAALPSLILRWCPVCSCFGRVPPPPAPAGGAPPPHPPSLDARLPSLFAFLALATGIRSVTLVDERLMSSAAAATTAATPAPPCARPTAVRMGVWGAVGAALAGRPLNELCAVEAAAASFFGGRLSGGGGGGGCRLRVLNLVVASAQVVGEAVTALQYVAPTLTELTIHCLPGVPTYLAHLFRSVGRLPELRFLWLIAAHDYPRGGKLGRDEAAAIADACAGVTVVMIDYPLSTGFGPPWALVCGALSNRHTLCLDEAEGRSSAIHVGNDYAAVLRHLPMINVRLTHTLGGTAPVDRALQSFDRRSTVLHLGANLGAADAARLLGDATTVADIKYMALNLVCRPHRVLPNIAMPPRLRALTLSCFTHGAADTPVCLSAHWDVPPTLRRLSVSHDYGLRAADGDESADLPLVRWLLAAVVASRGGFHLTELEVCARVRPGPGLDAALAPFVAAAAGTLERLQLLVQPAGEDGVEQRRQMAAALSAALPGASIAVASSVEGA